MKKSLWRIKVGFVAIFLLIVYADCRNHKGNDDKESKAMEHRAIPPVKEEAAKPTDNVKPNKNKVGQGLNGAPEHGTPNPVELDSLRNNMDKLREQEIKKKQKGECFIRLREYSGF